MLVHSLQWTANTAYRIARKEHHPMGWTALQVSTQTTTCCCPVHPRFTRTTGSQDWTIGSMRILFQIGGYNHWRNTIKLMVHMGQHCDKHLVIKLIPPSTFQQQGCRDSWMISLKPEQQPASPKASFVLLYLHGKRGSSSGSSRQEAAACLASICACCASLPSVWRLTTIICCATAGRDLYVKSCTIGDVGSTCCARTCYNLHRNSIVTHICHVTVFLLPAGGAFVAGDPLMYKPAYLTWMQQLAMHGIHMRVFAVGYPLAPEHAFPAALNAVTEAYQWLVQELGGSESIIIGEHQCSQSAYILPERPCHQAAASSRCEGGTWARQLLGRHNSPAA